MLKQKNVFEDMDALRQDSEQLKLKVKTGRSRHARSTESFARIPHDRGLRLYGQISAAAWVIMIELDRLIFKFKGQNPIPLKFDRLYAIGMARSTVNKALRQLQKAKVIQVKQWGSGRRNTMITHLWYQTS
jgi:hypothetical protein